MECDGHVVLLNWGESIEVDGNVAKELRCGTILRHGISWEPKPIWAAVAWMAGHWRTDECDILPSP